MDGFEEGNVVVCVEVDIFNGKMVDLFGVKWVIVIVVGLVFILLVIMFGFGYYNVVFYVVVNVFLFFGYFQVQVMFGFIGVFLLFVVMLWIQDFQWSMGIICFEFMQDIFIWYQCVIGGILVIIFDLFMIVFV